ncbi:pyrroline-5-carboxylate reductase [Halioxenophilus aromaticivorans]|uniref:Pyrroline-5-carboxylate reductase n=2 Tax=Halioxenophilus aromaticivorans TaxID=1306992 RepID=A0AAV3U0U2_9ALTE
MASAIIAGLIDGGHKPTTINVSDPSVEQLTRLQQQFGVLTSTDNLQAVADADVVVLAVKPQVLAQVATDLAAALQPEALVISIAAGIDCRSLSAWLGQGTAIVRCMPNTPALVNLGASGLYANPQTTAAQKVQAEAILAAVGIVVWLTDEDQLHAVTAVSGSGPAYFFLFMEAMIEVGVAQGLAPDLARSLTLQTALGASTLASNSEEGPDVLRQRVTSPNGTTEQAILSFERDDTRAVVKRAMAACAQRSVTLSEELGAK